jgi:Amt family ammonium transporter
MLNASLAASAGGVTAFLHYVFFHTDKSRMARGLGGFVSGLVAIAACAQNVTFAEAAFIGAVAGLLQNIAYNFLRKHFLQEVWQIQAAYLVAIHGVAGIWGALCFALLGTDGNFSSPDMPQLVTQIKGVVVAIIYSSIMARIVLFLIRLRNKNFQEAR